MKMKNVILIILSISLGLSQCDGFNWHHDIDINDCNKKDIEVVAKGNTLTIKSKKEKTSSTIS